MKKILLIITGLSISLCMYLVFSPSPIDADSYYPPKAPVLAGATAQNELLKKADLLGLGKVYGAEDVAIDSFGRIYGGTRDGKIIRILPSNGTVETFCNTNGRPLGLHFDKNANLIVADAWKGLLSIDTQGKITTLLTEANGIPFAFTNDLDISKEGIIFFSDASSKYHQPQYMLDAFEARPYGRLLRYDPASKSVRVLLNDLYFC